MAAHQSLDLFFKIFVYFDMALYSLLQFYVFLSVELDLLVVDGLRWEMAFGIRHFVFSRLLWLQLEYLQFELGYLLVILLYQLSAISLVLLKQVVLSIDSQISIEMLPDHLF